MSKDIEAGSNGDVEVGEAAAATVGTPSSSNFRQRKAMLLSFLFILAIVAVAIAGARSRVGYVAIGAMMVYGIHWTLIWLYESLVDPFLPSHGPRHKVKRTSARLAYYAVFFLSFATMFRHRDGDDVNAYDFMGLNCLGAYMIVIAVLFYVDLALAIAEVIRGVGPLVTPTEDVEAAEESEFRKKKAAICWALIAIGLIQSAVLCYAEPIITRLSIPLEDLHPCLDGYKIALISDIHVGVLVAKEEIEMTLRKANEEGVQSMAISGDLGDQKVGAAALHSMKPFVDDVDAQVPMLWTSGNHENFVGVKSWRTVIEDHGIINIENSFFVHRGVDFGWCGGTADGEADASINFVGLADLSGRSMQNTTSMYPESEFIVQPQLSQTMNSLSAHIGKPVSAADDVATVLLYHTPAEFKQNSEAGSDLQLSGHTHGGHVWPFHAFTLMYDGTSGLFSRSVAGGGDKKFMYVSEGVIGWGPRVRLFSRPEITIITLKSGGGEPSGDTGLRVGEAFKYITLVSLVLGALVHGYVMFIKATKKEATAAGEDKLK